MTDEYKGSAWDKKYVTDVTSGLKSLENMVESCDTSVLDKFFIVKSDIDSLLDHSDAEIEDFVADRKYENKLIELNGRFKRECVCSKK